MLQQIDLCKFQPKHAYTLSPVASSDGTHKRRKEMFTTNYSWFALTVWLG